MGNVFLPYLGNHNPYLTLAELWNPTYAYLAKSKQMPTTTQLLSTWHDLGVNKVNGIQNTPTYQPTFNPAKPPCILYNGLDKRLEMDIPVAFFNSDFSIAMRIKFPSATITSAIFSAGTYYGFKLIVMSVTNGTISYEEGSRAGIISIANSVKANQYQDIILTKSAASKQEILYVDEEMATATAGNTLSLSSAQKFRLGSYTLPGTVTNPNFEINRLMLYPRILTQTEVNTLRSLP